MYSTGMWDTPVTARAWTRTGATVSIGAASCCRLGEERKEEDDGWGHTSVTWRWRKVEGILGNTRIQLTVGGPNVLKSVQSGTFQAMEEL